MASVDILELKARASAIVRGVQESGEAVEITDHGAVVARIVPARTEAEEQAEIDRIWAEMDALAEEIGAAWPEGVSAVEAVREVRREL